ncbi:MAG: RNA polymerase sigma factor [Clostridia bacterium]|nr:RNA polymerase sigma factor [Clostridia bacterium]
MDFEQIYRTYFHDVYRYIRRLSGSEQLAEEITSETFFRAMQAIDHFRGDCDIRVWLCQIAKNCYVSHCRKLGRVGDLDDTAWLTIPDPDETAEEQIIRRDEAAQIRAILHELPEPYREVFMWRVYAELSFAQIGQIFSKSENWACVTYHRARRKIIERMEESEYAQ